MSGLWQDIRFGARQLARAPGFTAAAVLSLAIGIGANTAVFSVVSNVLFDALPYAEPDALVEVWETYRHPGGTGRGSVSVPNLDDWRAQQDVFEDIAAYTNRALNLSAGDRPERLSGALVTEPAFRLLGVPPLLGRYLIPSDFEAGNSNVVVLSHRLWRDKFAGDAAIVGRQVRINGVAHDVAGVMPPQFSFPPRSDREIWAPLTFTEAERASRGNHWLLAFARLRPGVSQSDAEAGIAIVARRLAEDYPAQQEDRGALLRSFEEALTGSSKPVLLAMWGAVGFVLLIACGNVANLQLARASARSRELAVRNAMGAGRGRLIRQSLTESLLLAAAGGAAGLVLCYWTIPLLRELPGANLPGDAGVDAKVLLSCATASIAAAMLGGLAPALRMSKAAPLDDLRTSGGALGKDPARDLLRKSLVIAEVALALVVVVGAGLLVKSFERMRAIDPGLRPENVLTLKIPLMAERYEDAGEVRTFYTRLLERVEAMAAVRSAGLTQLLPIQSWGWNGEFRIRGREAGSDAPFAEFRWISASYFDALGVPLIAGRKLTTQDMAPAGPRSAIVNQALAQRYWPNEDPLGKQVGQCAPDDDDCWYTIVGVVGNTRNAGFRNSPQAVAYMPYTHAANQAMTLVVRTSVTPTNLIEAVRQEVLALDPEQPIYNVWTMEQVIADRIAPERFQTLAFSVFGLLATVLAMAGIYGLISYSTSRRTREMGLRLALGAAGGDLRLLVVRQGLLLGLYGIGLGLLLALLLGRSLESLLFEVEPADPLVLVAVAVGTAAVTALASYWPALRASRLDPMEALRQD